MKKLLFNNNTLSINSNTNRAISSTEDSWASVRPGSLLKLQNDNTFYNILEASSFLHVKDFSVDKNQLIINGNDSNFSIGDTLKISYKEYEIATVIKSVNGGKRYKIGDIISLDSGVCSVNTYDGSENNATFRVNQIDVNGSITQLFLVNRGKYIIPPDNITEVYGGSGTGASLEIQTKLLDQRVILERIITNVSSDNISTYLYLDAPVPNGVVDGKVSVEKWQMLISPNYSGSNVFNISYEIVKDFTPHFNFTYLVKGTNAPEVIYNENLKKLDNILKGIYDKLK